MDKCRKKGVNFVTIKKLKQLQVNKDKYYVNKNLIKKVMILI